MKMLFDFDSEAACNLWMPVNDVVMGGVSHSKLEYIGASTGAFSGIVSLKNSGGFASVRTMTSLYDLGRYKGVMVRVRGDGKQYKMNLKTEAILDGVQYQAAFAPPQGVWSEVMLPFSKFLPMFRGARARLSPSLDTHSIHSFGFLISDKQEGAFRMEIDWIGAYS
jgi:hypothetical protein